MNYPLRHVTAKIERIRAIMERYQQAAPTRLTWRGLPARFARSGPGTVPKPLRASGQAESRPKNYPAGVAGPAAAKQASAPPLSKVAVSQ